MIGTWRSWIRDIHGWSYSIYLGIFLDFKLINMHCMINKIWIENIHMIKQACDQLKKCFSQQIHTKVCIQSNLVIRNFSVTLNISLMPNVPYPYEVNWHLVTGNGSLIPICSLANRSLLPSLTVPYFLKVCPIFVGHISQFSKYSNFHEDRWFFLINSVNYVPAI